MATVSLVVLFVRYRLPSFFFFFSCRPSVRPFLSFVPASFHRALPLAISPPSLLLPLLLLLLATALVVVALKQLIRLALLACLLLLVVLVVVWVFFPNLCKKPKKGCETVFLLLLLLLLLGRGCCVCLPTSRCTTKARTAAKPNNTPSGPPGSPTQRAVIHKATKQTNRRARHGTHKGMGHSTLMCSPNPPPPPAR